MKFDDSQAIYLQIADYIAARIVVGEWPEGERIPSVRDLSAQLSVNVNTAMRSFNFLQELSIIGNQRGLGYFVAEGGRQRVAEWQRRRFEEQDMPRFFRQAALLEYPPEQLQARYQDFLDEQYNQEEQSDNE